MGMWTAYEFMILGTVLLFSSLSVPSIHYVIARKFTDQLGENSSPDFRPSVTLLLPMRNESSNVERKILESLSLEYPEEKLKIIVVDSCSVDDTAIIARGLLGGRGVVISLERPGKSLAINSALDIIDTDFFAMMDADAICPPDSLSKLIEWFADPEIGAV